MPTIEKPLSKWFEQEEDPGTFKWLRDLQLRNEIAERRKQLEAEEKKEKAEKAAQKKKEALELKAVLEAEKAKKKAEKEKAERRKRKTQQRAEQRKKQKEADPVKYLEKMKLDQWYYRNVTQKEQKAAKAALEDKGEA